MVPPFTGQSLSAGTGLTDGGTKFPGSAAVWAAGGYAKGSLRGPCGSLGSAREKRNCSSPTVCVARSIVETRPGWRERPLHASQYARMIASCRKTRRWAHAVRLLQEMIDCGQSPDVSVYNDAIDACLQERKWEEALMLHDKLRKSGVEPNIDTYNIAVDACNEGGQWELALYLLSEMRLIGFVPSGDTYESVLGACEKAGRYGEVLALLEDMLQNGLPADLIKQWRERLASRVAQGSWSKWESWRALQKNETKGY